MGRSYSVPVMKAALLVVKILRSRPLARRLPLDDKYYLFCHCERSEESWVFGQAPSFLHKQQQNMWTEVT
ncbi:MAG: hypothetical protein WAO23_01800, partial [Dethiobacteria bacterium]